MIDQGWIKLFRKFSEWEWYKNVNVKSLFIELLLTVNYEDKKWQGIDIKRGQIVTGIEELGKRTGLNRQQTRTAINKLILTKEITKVSTPFYTIITVNNYDKYQDITKVLTNDQPTSNQPLTTTKEYKKEKNITNDKEANEILIFFNLTFKRNYKSIEAWNSNYCYWRTIYGIDDIKKAIENAYQDEKWRSFLEPVILFRRKNPSGEKVDYIGKLMNMKNQTFTNSKSYEEINTNI